MKHNTFPTWGALALLPIVALVFLNSCKSSSTAVTVQQPLAVHGHAPTGDTIRGPLDGYLESGKTYYMDSDVVLSGATDTLLIQKGVTIIILPKTNYYPEFILTKGGTLVSNGTSDAPIYITVPQSYRTLANLQIGLWGGIQCDLNSGDLILKWTHLSHFGGAGTPVGTAKKVPYGIYFQNQAANFIMEDCWFTGGTDDPIRAAAGNLWIYRNVFEAGSTTSGDGVNMKSGAIGDVAYNLFIGNCTNGPKEANKGGAQVNANIFNNTIVCDGWRFTGGIRAGSIDIEDDAEGTVYNNMIINCHTGFRMVSSPLADTLHTHYGYNYMYALTDSIRRGFYTGYTGYTDDGQSCERPMPGDVAGTAGANDPKFVGYDVTAVSASHFSFPIAFASQDPRELIVTTTDALGQRFSDVSTTFTSNFHLTSSSPAVGKAYTASTAAGQAALPSGIRIPMVAVTSIKSTTNPFGADYTTTGLGKDYGAYQQDNSGNQQ